MSILLKEHFNRWYSLKMYYASVTLLSIPISVVCCVIFTVIIYLMSGQPLEWSRFAMFFAISLMMDFVGQTMGLMVGAWFDVVVRIKYEFSFVNMYYNYDRIIEWHVFGTYTFHSNDDVRRFWCDSS